MPNGQTLQFATLPARQPNVGAALLNAHVPAAVIRLSLDPTRLPAGTMDREVTVEWVRKPGRDLPATLHREISWEGLPNLAEDCVTFPLTWNDTDLTELGAIAVMALLVHELEGGVIDRVLPIGSGGDYLITTPGSRAPGQVEVSGVTEDGDSRETRKRVKKKADQVLTHARAGFVSVTAFSHPPAGGVRSFLHFVRRPRK
ncbi:MAG TPA: hypothetical protein VH092_27565 [Urbifossiella sp.]|jgi:hypothetical protein|nr:hypothetical protein [Urbifossiella sp.]